MSPSPRDQLLFQVAHRLAEIRLPHPTRVAIDGLPAVGKTTFGDALAACFEEYNRPVIRASVDHFHRPHSVRYQRGENSAEGYYDDNYNYPAFLKELLVPLGPGGSRCYRACIFDVTTDRPYISQRLQAQDDSILVVDGIFLQRPELRWAFDYAIYLAASFDVALQRALRRDAHDSLTVQRLRSKYMRRYWPGQRLYLDAVQPQSRANAVIENSDPDCPRLLRLT